MENAPVSIAGTNNESEDKTVNLELPRSERTKTLWRNLTDIPVFAFFFAYSFSGIFFRISLLNKLINLLLISSHYESGLCHLKLIIPVDSLKFSIM